MQTSRQAGRQAGRQLAGRQAGKRASRQASRQAAGRQVDRQAFVVSIRKMIGYMSYMGLYSFLSQAVANSEKKKELSSLSLVRLHSEIAALRLRTN